MIHLSQACSLWPCYHFDYPQLAPEGCIVNYIMFQEKIRHLGNDLAVVPTVASHCHTVRESKRGSRREKTWWGSGAVGVDKTESMVRRLHCRSKGQTTRAHTSRYLF
jgi:hypothetical protein